MTANKYINLLFGAVLLVGGRGPWMSWRGDGGFLPKELRELS